MERETEWGQTIVHEDVLATLAARATLAVPGVMQMSYHRISENLSGLVRHDLLSRGVRVTDLDQGHYALELHVIVQYGIKMGQLARAIAKSVNQVLKDAVGLYPDSLVVHIEGVRRLGE